ERLSRVSLLAADEGGAIGALKELSLLAPQQETYRKRLRILGVEDLVEAGVSIPQTVIAPAEPAYREGGSVSSEGTGQDAIVDNFDADTNNQPQSDEWVLGESDADECDDECPDESDDEWNDIAEDEEWLDPVSDEASIDENAESLSADHEDDSRAGQIETSEAVFFDSLSEFKPGDADAVPGDSQSLEDRDDVWSGNPEDESESVPFLCYRLSDATTEYLLSPD